MEPFLILAQTTVPTGLPDPRRHAITLERDMQGWARLRNSAFSEAPFVFGSYKSSVARSLTYLFGITIKISPG